MLDNNNNNNKKSPTLSIHPPKKEMTLISMDNSIFASYAFYAALVALKLIFMAPLTGYFRMKNKAFANPEDASNFKMKVKIDPWSKESEAHLNDLENIPTFWILGFLFVITNPSAGTALMCFRVFAVARILHSIMYLLEIFPVRALCFVTGLLVNLYMGISIVLYLL
ncbi:Microsomal glutathione S-transferase 1 [Armadillidium vulgare]|nr:Microsomal glutathione S-transferase 1 [Armadillidium vulgare]